MEIRQLEMLLAVADRGGYAPAGEALHISHSAIHRQIRILEEELRERLLVRKGRRVELTESGVILLAAARRILREVSDTVLRINEASTLQRGSVRVGTGDSILFSYLPPILHRFRKEFPGIELYVMTTTAGHVLEEILSGRLDIGIMFNPRGSLRGGESFKYEVLYQEKFVWVVSRAHPLAHRKVVSLSELAKFPFVMFSTSSHIRRICDRLLAQTGIMPRVAMELENEEAVGRAVEINMGAALLPVHRAQNHKVRHLRIATGDIHGEVGMVLPNREYVPRAVKEFVRLCRIATPP
jgi:LysR family transcriptional regulator, cyn operon transcriptional activator